MYQRADPHHHLPCASPLPARGWDRAAFMCPPPPPLLPHIPSLSVICQVVRNKALELETCSVMSRKGLRLGGLAVEERIGAEE